MRVFVDHPEDVAAFVASIGGKPFHAPYTTIGVHDNGTLTGGFVFTGYNGDGIEMSLAGSGVKGRDAWRAVLAYVFDQLGCSRLQVHTRKDNKRARTMATRLGLHYEGTMRRFYGDVSGLCYSLTVDDLAVFRARWKL